jgi:hypothetical protein
MSIVGLVSRGRGRGGIKSHDRRGDWAEIVRVHADGRAEGL